MQLFSCIADTYNSRSSAHLNRRCRSKASCWFIDDQPSASRSWLTHNTFSFTSDAHNSESRFQQNLWSRSSAVCSGIKGQSCESRLLLKHQTWSLIERHWQRFIFMETKSRLTERNIWLMHWRSIEWVLMSTNQISNIAARHRHLQRWTWTATESAIQEQKILLLRWRLTKWAMAFNETLKMISHRKTLTTLNLDSNIIGHIGAEHLASALKINRVSHKPH